VRVTLSDPQRLKQLVDYLSFDPTVVVTQLSANEIEVAFMGSLSTTGQVMETELRLRAWLAAHPDVIVTMSE
jgi:ABC-type hemin transport system substrate-binding protein